MRITLSLLASGAAMAASEKKPLAEMPSRIVGGADAPTGEYPWMAALLYEDWGSTPTTVAEQQGCGGALIHPRWVLTAAHCGIPSRVLIGAHNLENWETENFGYSPEMRNVAGYVAHPGYNKNNLYHDVQLIKLDEPSTLPVLSIAATTPIAGATVTAIGWGDTTVSDDDTNFPLTLQAVTMDVIECSDAHDDVHASFLCASPPNSGKDACQGDSGGPLIGTDVDDTHVLVGATSWGIGCNGGGVYADVADYISFVDSIIESGDVCPNDATWTFKNKHSKNCDWVAKKPSERCNKKSSTKVEAATVCQQACGCTTCEDDLTWLFKNKAKKDCAWVAKKPSKRCNKKSQDKVKASNVCKVACGVCENDDDDYEWGDHGEGGDEEEDAGEDKDEGEEDSGEEKDEEEEDSGEDKDEEEEDGDEDKDEEEEDGDEDKDEEEEDGDEDKDEEEEDGDKDKDDEEEDGDEDKDEEEEDGDEDKDEEEDED